MSVSPASRAAARHPVEGRGDVGAHRLAAAVGERSRVAAAARRRRHPGPRARRRRGLGRRVGDDGNRAPTGFGRIDLAADHDLGPDRQRLPPIGKRDLDSRGSDAVDPRRRSGGVGGAGQEGGLAQVAGVDGAVFESRRGAEPAGVVAHRTRRRDRREIGGALGPALAGHRADDRDQGEGGDHHRRERAEHRRQRWPSSASRPRARRRARVPTVPPGRSRRARGARRLGRAPGSRPAPSARGGADRRRRARQAGGRAAARRAAVRHGSRNRGRRCQRSAGK